MACPDPLCGYPNLIRIHCAPTDGTWYLCRHCSGVWRLEEIEPWRSKPPNMLRAAIVMLLFSAAAFWLLAKGW